MDRSEWFEAVELARAKVAEPPMVPRTDAASALVAGIGIPSDVGTCRGVGGAEESVFDGRERMETFELEAPPPIASVLTLGSMWDTFGGRGNNGVSFFRLENRKKVDVVDTVWVVVVVVTTISAELASDRDDSDSRGCGIGRPCSSYGGGAKLCVDPLFG